ncbi:MAG: hypothetical protein Q7T03_04250 [Deltaproteobacteria bacterium]|nr:hypothetical protein [Deltaproteobacteria bacterium]
MKNRLLVVAGILFCVGFCWSRAGTAKISRQAFESPQKMTAGQLLLNQVDAVSLYLTTEKIVYVPRIREDQKLYVSLTLLGISFGDDRRAMQEYIQRHINAFNKALSERLKFYTPELAREFDPKEDVEFVVKNGAEGTPIATWKNGQWTWSETGKPIAVFQSDSPAGSPEVRVKKRCPALIGSATATSVLPDPKEETAAPKIEIEAGGEEATSVKIPTSRVGVGS